MSSRRSTSIGAKHTSSKASIGKPPSNFRTLFNSIPSFASALRTRANVSEAERLVACIPGTHAHRSDRSREFQSATGFGELAACGRQSPGGARSRSNRTEGDPQNAQAQAILSSADASQGNLPKALGEAQQAIQMDPNRSQSFLLLGGDSGKIERSVRPRSKVI